MFILPGAISFGKWKSQQTLFDPSNLCHEYTPLVQDLAENDKWELSDPNSPLAENRLSYYFILILFVIQLGFMVNLFHAQEAHVLLEWVILVLPMLEWVK